MVRGSTFTVQVEVQNVRGSTLLRHERHATDMSVTSLASENARRAGRARLARRAIGQSGLSGLSSTILDEAGDDSARLVACLARIIHDGSSRSGARHERGPAGLSCLSGLSRLFG